MVCKVSPRFKRAIYACAEATEGYNFGLGIVPNIILFPSSKFHLNSSSVSRVINKEVSFRCVCFCF